MSRSKNRNNSAKGVNQPKPQGQSSEFVYVETAPKRDNFSIADFKSAVKQAENIENPSRIKLLDYYNEICMDLHLSAVIDKRRNNIKSTKFVFKDAKGNEIETINQLMSSPQWRKMLVDRIDAEFTGYGVGWLDLSGGILQKYKLLPRKHILPEKGEFITKQTDRFGIKYREGLYPNYVLEYGEVDNFGLLLKAIPWILLKRGDISDWATFNEIFAMPFRIAKYPQYDTVAKKALAEACQNSASNGFAIIPNTTDLSFVESQSSSSSSAYESFATFCDKQISKGFILNTMTLDAEGGNYKGDVHQQSENGVYAADRQLILDFLNTTVLSLLEAHGWSPNDGKFEIETEDHICLEDRILIDEKIDSHVEIPAEYWYKKYGIPVPKGGAKAKVNQSANLSDNTKQIAFLKAQLADLVAESENRTMDVDIPKRGFFV